MNSLEKKKISTIPDDFETDVDMTGRSINVLDDTEPLTETNCSGRSIIRIEDEDDPETETNCSGRSILLIDNDDDPETDVDFTGTSIANVEKELTDHSITASAQTMANHKLHKEDPLASFETEAADFTGICVQHADSSMALADPETETNCSGRSITMIENEDDPETETNCSGRSITMIEDEDDPETDIDATGRGMGKIS